MTTSSRITQFEFVIQEQLRQQSLMNSVDSQENQRVCLWVFFRFFAPLKTLYFIFLNVN